MAVPTLRARRSSREKGEVQMGMGMRRKETAAAGWTILMRTRKTRIPHTPGWRIRRRTRKPNHGTNPRRPTGPVPTPRMTRRPALKITLIVVAVLAAAGIAVAVAIPGEAALARRAEQALTEKLGVPVRIGRLHWQLLPVPMVEVFDATTEQEKPVVIRHFAVWPRIGPLLRRQLAFDRALLDGARIPQWSVKAFRKDGGTDPQDAKDRFFRLADQPLRRAEFRDVVWIGRREIPLTLEGDADFDTAWRPRQASVQVAGAQPPARLDLRRIDGQDRFQADIAVASGTWNGTLDVTRPTAGRWRVTGALQPRDIDLRQLLETFRRKPVIAGRARGETTLEAEGGSVGELVQSLHTRTRFSVDPATVLRFDLDRAIRSVGKEHQGTTPLQTLTGVLDTQNDDAGIVMRYSSLKARSGALSATGTVVLQNRQIDADIAVDLVDGVVGVPLRITGPVSDPRYSVPPAAVAGAAVGTAVLPGVGTALGARIGDAIGRLFGSDRKPAAKP
ncbi:hypothetical protein GN316_17905 [Xylophilus sp. Kf1]|nr:hypothetical protein [Xylophilus sp. Kf1]